MRLKDTLFLLANGYSKKEIDKLDAEEAEALKAEAEAKQAEEAKKLEGINKELEDAKKALQEQQKKNINEIDIGKPSDDNNNMDELLKTIASYM